MNRIYAKLLAAAALAMCAIAPASAQTPVTVSAWGTPVTIVGGGKPNGPAMLDQNGQIPVVNLGNALSSYVTQTGLTTALAGYLPLTALASPMTLTSTLDVKGAVTLENTVHVEGDAKVDGDVHLGGVFTQSSATSSSGKWTGQGAGLTWNQVNGGRGATEIVNVNPGVRGGFDFFDVGTGGTLDSSSSPLLSMSTSSGYQFYNLAGTGTAYVCVSSTGVLSRSSTACN